MYSLQQEKTVKTQVTLNYTECIDVTIGTTQNIFQSLVTTFCNEQGFHPEILDYSVTDNYELHIVIEGITHVVGILPEHLKYILQTNIYLQTLRESIND